MEKLGTVAAGMSSELQTADRRGTELSRTREYRTQLKLLLKQMSAAFPHQEVAAETAQVWSMAFEELVSRHGIQNLEAALRLFLTRQKWFPHPSEVSEVLDEMATKTEQEAAKNLPKIGCEICAEFAPGLVGYVIEQRPGHGREVKACACRIAREKAKREAVA